MDSVKRTSSASLPKTRESCGNYGSLRVMRSQQNPDNGQLRGNRRPLRAQSVLMSPVAQPAAYYGTDFARSVTMIPGHTSRDINSQPSIKRRRSEAQAQEYSRVQHIPSRTISSSPELAREVGKSCGSTHLFYGISRHGTGLGRPHLGSSRILDGHAHRNDKRPFGKAIQNRSSSSCMYNSVNGVEKSCQGMLYGGGGVDNFEDNLINIDHPSKPTPEQADARVLDQTLDDLSTETYRSFEVASQIPSEFTARAADIGDTLNGVYSCSDNVRPCFMMAIRLLRTLHVPSLVCLSIRDNSSTLCPSYPRSIDFVLSTNRDIVQFLFQMLECSCSTNTQLQLVIAVICNKLIAWYRAMIWKDNESNGNDAFSQCMGTRSTNNITQPQHVERISHLPITVGNYTLDDIVLEGKIRGQLVLNELQRLDLLVNHLPKDFKEAKARFSNDVGIPSNGGGKWSVPKPGSSTSPDEIEITPIVQSKLHSFLQKQLEVEKARTMSQVDGR